MKAWQQFEKQVAEVARLGGWLVHACGDSRRSTAGLPDLVLVHPERKLVLYRELKTGRGRLSDIQKVWLDALTAAGADARVWRPDDWDEIERTLLGPR